MAVNRRLRSRGAPARMAPAMFSGITETPERATGNWDSRVVAVYGTEPIPAPLPWVAQRYPIPPGPTTGHSAATGPFGWWTFSQVYPSIPRHFNTAGTDIHPTTTTVISSQPVPQQVPYKGAVVRAGYAQGRVTMQPKPTLPWLTRVQGMMKKKKS